MLLYIFRRALSLVLVLLAATSFTFVMGKLAPGDPIQVMMGLHHDPATRQNLLHLYGLDIPWWQQYLLFLWRAVHGNLGYSYQFLDTEVTTILLRQVPVSVQLGLLGLLAGVVMGIFPGIVAAIKERTWTDHGILFVQMGFYSIPNFVFIPLLWIADKALNYPLPVAGWSWSSPLTIVLPVFSVAIATCGYFALLSRNAMLEVLRQDYIRTARAKGLSESKVIYVHALRNAMLPIVTYFGLSLAVLVVGQIVTEPLFNIPGIANLTVTAVLNADYPVVQGTVMLLAATVVVVNFLTDVAYGLLDPRIRSA
jgi:ABC-type dipeptide/oligopeptide/nickel transport system permease component